jgi:hypothetical protein
VTNVLTYTNSQGDAQTVDLGALVKANESLTVLGFDKATQVLTYTDESGVPYDLDLGIGTVSYDATSNTITYTDASGAPTQLVLNETSLVYNDVTNVLTYTNSQGDAQTVDLGALVKANESLTVLGFDKATQVLTYTDESGVPYDLDLGIGTVSYDAANNTITYTDASGASTPLALNQTGLVYDGTANTLTYTNSQGVGQIINIATLIADQGRNLTGVVDNPLGSRITVTNGTGTVLKNTTLDVNEANLRLQSIGGTLQVAQIQNGAANQVLMTNVGGNGVTWANPIALGTGSITSISTDLTITNGNLSILKDVDFAITDGAITTAKLDDEAVTTAKLAENTVTADKLNSGTSTNGQVATANGDGTVTYKDIAVTEANITSSQGVTTDGIIKVNDADSEASSVLKDLALSIAAESITSTQIKDGEVNTADLANNAVTTGKIIDGAVTPAKIETGGTDMVLVTNSSGAAEWVDRADFAISIADGNVTAVSGTGTAADPLKTDVKVNNGLTINATDSLVQLGGALVKATTITTGSANTLAIEGLQTPTVTAGVTENYNMIVADPNGVLKQVKQTPRFFYMPAVIFDTQTAGTGIRDLYADYVNQFTGVAHAIVHGPAGSTPEQYTGGLVRSGQGTADEAPAQIAVYETNELYYYVTYFDQDVFENLSISADGKLEYTVKAGATEASYMNIVFVVKD